MTRISTAALHITPLTRSIGAEVSGLSLAATLADEVIAQLRAALLRHKVLFFREQHLTPSQQVAFGRRFGVLTPAHPLLGGLDAEHPEILVLDSQDYPLGVGTRTRGTSYNNRWHTDVTFSETPPMGSLLAAKKLPSVGGDTLWADLQDAYGTLSAPLRALLDGLIAIHSAQGAFGRFQHDDPNGENRAKLAKLAPVRHPVVRVHPETQARGLFVNPTFTVELEGLAPKESDALLQLLYAHLTEPERVVRWRWRAGDLAFWDNRATSHYAAADYDERRVMHRITVAGDRPLGLLPVA